MKVEKFDYNKTKNLIIDTISDIEEEYDVENGNFQFGYYKKTYDEVKKDIDILISELKKNGVNLSDFFKLYKNEIYKDYNFESHSAFMDAILYYFDKDKGILSGVKLEDSNEFEFLIKYKYGYYNYDMGKKFILQSYDDMDAYYQDTAEKLLLGLLSPEGRNNIGDEFTGTKDNAENIVEKCSIVKQYDNGFTIFIHLKSFMTELSKYSMAKYDYSMFVDTLESDIDPIPYRIFDDLMQIFIGYTVHKISLEEFNSIKNELDVNYQSNIYNL